MSFNPIDTFLQEAEELLAEIEQCALSLGGSEQDAETVNRLFRAFHTVKGSGAMCGLDAVAEFTHHVEDLLDKVRAGDVPVSRELSQMVLRAKDHIKALLGEQQGGLAVPVEIGRELVAAVDRLAMCSGGGVQGITAAEPVCATEEQARWSIRFRPDPGLLLRGCTPGTVLRELRDLGECAITAHTENVPPLDEIQPDLCFLWWMIEIRADCDRNAIQDVFLFVEDGSKIDIERIETATGVEKVEAAQVAGVSPRRAQKGWSRESTVRVPAARLDRLVNLVGELVMNQSRLAQVTGRNAAPELAYPVQELERLVAELRDNVLGIRMLPIGTLFGRFSRVVHDLSAELGKEADLVTEGAETELDKSILDQLGEPLVHCLRNCLDHGIEPPEQREGRGKPRRGRILLSAMHTGSDVVVSIRDDGRGVDRAAVRDKAVERGLIAPGAGLSDKDLFNLILLPGFSTARQVTTVSGRGVGMDAVKRQIEALRGSLSLASEEGKGTTVSITLPLTLAIIEGLLVEIGTDQFIIPMAAVTENVELASAERAKHNGRNLIAVRGELVPYIDLRQTFAIGGAPAVMEKVVIVQHEDHRVGLVVDRVLGTHQTVIQSLGRFFRKIDVVSGATIMGDGRVALIMDVAAVVRHTEIDCLRGVMGGKITASEAA